VAKKSKPEYCFLKNDKFVCERCNGSEVVKLPMPIDDFVKAINKFVKKHKACEKVESIYQGDKNHE